MLVLSRRAGESFVIGDFIEISVVEVQGDRVRIGVSAPKEVRVLRSELFEEVRRINLQAAANITPLGALSEVIKK
jgi:carbon storage regulator